MNEFPLAPDWAWNARISMFPLQLSPEHPAISAAGAPAPEETVLSLDDFLALDKDEYDRRARMVVDKGVNLVQATSFHFRFSYAERFDAIAEITRRVTEACHKVGVKVFEHHSSNFIGRGEDDPDLDRGNPEPLYRGWDPRSALAVDIRTGEPSGLYGDLPGVFLCINNSEYKSNYAHYVLDFIKNTGLDGLMHDDIHFGSQYFCGCRDCRTKFRGAMGYDLPANGQFPVDDYSNPVWRDWLRFRLISARDQVRELRQRLPENLLFFACMSAGVLNDADVHHSGSSLEALAEGTNCMFTEGGNLYGFRNPSTDWGTDTGHRNFFANWERLFIEKKYIGAICHSFRQPAYDLHYPANRKEDFFCWALSKISGHCLWRGDMASIPFADWEPEYDCFNWERENEHLFRFPRNLGDIGVVFSQRTKLNLGVDSQHHGEPWVGWVQALLEAGYVADGLIDRDLEDPDRLRGHRLVILPNVVCLSEAGAENLRQYVRAGGNLIATHQTSLANADGERCEDFALADLFGCHFERVRAQERISWFVDRRFASEPLFSDVPPRLGFFPGLTVSWEGEGTDRKVLGWSEKTSAYDDGPQKPAMIRCRIGQGTVIYLTPRIGALAYRQGPFPIWALQSHQQRFVETNDQGRRILVWRTPADKNFCKWFFVDDGNAHYRKLIANLVRYLLPDPTVRLRAPQGLLHSCFRQAEGPAADAADGNLVVGLLNMTGARFQDGQELTPPSRVHYPTLTGNLEIVLNEPARGAAFHSPDTSAPVPLENVALGSQTLLRLNLENLKRVGFVLVERAGNDESSG